MENRPEHDELLRDVFAQATPLREELLQKSVGVARRRKQRKQFRAVAVTICVFAAAICGIYFRSPPKSQPTSTEQGVTIVHSAAVSPAMMVTSTRTVTEIHSSPSGDMLVQSSAEGFQTIGEDDLLRLLSGKPVVLVREDTGTRLVFLNPSDQNGFPVQ